MHRKTRVNMLMKSCNGKGGKEKTTENPLEVSEKKTQTQLG